MVWAQGDCDWLVGAVLLLVYKNGCEKMVEFRTLLQYMASE